MRRAPLALVLALLAVTAAASLAGCGGPTVGDGDLGGDWVAFEEPKVPTPDAGVCRFDSVNFVDFDLSLFKTPPSECTRAHQAETFYVGTLTGSAAEGTASPDVGDSAFKTASQTCDKQAAKFLGQFVHESQRRRLLVHPVDVLTP